MTERAFQDVNNSVLLSKGDAGTDGPSVIVIFAWMDARVPHILKYAEALRGFYPSSTIAIVKSTSAYLWTSTSAQEILLAPIVHLIREAQEAETTYRGILFHVFSNVGALQFVTLTKLLANHTMSGQALKTAPVALVLDSAPGSSALEPLIATTIPKNPILRLVAIPLITSVYYIHYFISSLFGKPPVFQELRESLNNPNLFASLLDETSTKLTPRLYIYSEADALVPVANVEEHIADAKSKGLNVRVEKFEKSAHVSHARADDARYWGAIKGLWNEVSKL